MKRRGVIIIHPSPMTRCYAFDVFAESSIEDLDLYVAEDCPYVRKYMDEMIQRGLKYLGSGDFCHIREINKRLEKKLNQLIKEGFEVILLSDMLEGEDY